MTFGPIWPDSPRKAAGERFGTADPELVQLRIDLELSGHPGAATSTLFCTVCHPKIKKRKRGGKGLLSAFSQPAPDHPARGMWHVLYPSAQPCIECLLVRLHIRCYDSRWQAATPRRRTRMISCLGTCSGTPPTSRTKPSTTGCSSSSS